MSKWLEGSDTYAQADSTERNKLRHSVTHIQKQLGICVLTSHSL
jgi:hypothetical protein